MQVIPVCEFKTWITERDADKTRDVKMTCKPL